MTQLLRSMPTPAPLKNYVDALLHVADSARPPSPAAVRMRANSFLTSREMEVLRLLSSRLTSREMAETLFISMNTLKSHMKNVYVKLHVNSRAEAVSAADARNLL
jgi:LuxR family maltose regulon positive regulatory protein